MGGRGGSPESSAVYFPGTGREKFRGAVPPGAFDWFAQSTAKYGGAPGAGGLGRLSMKDIPQEWIGDPRYGGFLQWLQEQGMADTPPPSYEVTPPGGPEAPVPPPPAGGGPAEGAPQPPQAPGSEPPAFGSPGGGSEVGPPAGGPPGEPGGIAPFDLGGPSVKEEMYGGDQGGGPGGFFGDSAPGVIPGEPGPGQESTKGVDYSELTPEEKEQLEEEEGDKFFA